MVNITDIHILVIILKKYIDFIFYFGVEVFSCNNFYSFIVKKTEMAVPSLCEFRVTVKFKTQIHTNCYKERSGIHTIFRFVG